MSKPRNTKVEIKDLYKIFGPDPKSQVAKVKKFDKVNVSRPAQAGISNNMNSQIISYTLKLHLHTRDGSPWLSVTPARKKAAKNKRLSSSAVAGRR